MANVLIACEFSGVVREAFRKKGHNAWSCDILPTEIEGQHIQADILDVLYNEEVSFYGVPKHWDLIIAFPYCTHTAVSGARWFKEKVKDGRQQKAIKFFMSFVNAPCEKIAIEHPISIMSRVYRKPDQIIQPWMFGHGEIKATCLWLKGLPILHPTNIVDGREARVHKMPPSKDRWKERSRTLKGIAEALATQYTSFIKSKMTVTEWENLLKDLDISGRNAIIDKYVQL